MSGVQFGKAERDSKAAARKAAALKIFDWIEVIEEEIYENYSRLEILKARDEIYENNRAGE